MTPPKFPHEFVKNHCPKVLEARRYRKIYEVEGTDDDDCDFAECAFVDGIGAGGMKCENCDLCLIPTPPTNPSDDFIPAIRQYYKDADEYELTMKNLGAGI